MTGTDKGINDMSFKISKYAAAAAIGVTMLAAAPAAAVVVTRSYTVTANFIQQSAPVKALTLNFTLVYDPTVSVSNAAVASYASSSAAAQFNSQPILYGTDYYAGFGTYLMVSGSPGGSRYVEGRNDFFVQFLVDAQGTPVPGRTANVEYSFVGIRGTYNTPLAAVILNGMPGGPGGVPEPASWAMLLAGFGLTGAAMRRRRGHRLDIIAA